ncbi:hypothetical protein MJG53_011449 [Ovis ammon polii x Ovis aries]|uniref:Uncharacterized protein n=3 Tax=Ovis TaxID=9935 RepID=A0A836CXG1_SHEEP|nr:hypothetical protein JEQ12_004055 [Ovis aries]KAI4536573.1 hypothetical protein MG293_012776 [Ovis ammon polii]KAI4563436.1 hypothetical protein MJT46_011045 [Ovis ammon polii x Ovis aries]KAI4578594.1 hypothetical protein MJG53_011449 [Ovis ammon polii x Ovis aries]
MEKAAARSGLGPLVLRVGKDLREGPGRASVDRPPAQRVSPRSGRGARLRRDVVTNPGGKKRHTSFPSVTLESDPEARLA